MEQYRETVIRKDAEFTVPTPINSRGNGPNSEEARYHEAELKYVPEKSEKFQIQTSPSRSLEKGKKWDSTRFEEVASK